MESIKLINSVKAYREAAMEPCALCSEENKKSKRLNKPGA
jgi:hypothetical protein